MFAIFLVAFITVPIIEIAVFIQLGSFIGLWPTIAFVVLTAIVGASLVRSQGILTLAAVQRRMQQGELPALQIMEGVMLAVAGILLLTPGFVTDFLGLLLLLPVPRAYLANYLMGKLVVHSMGGATFYSSSSTFDGHSTSHGDTFDGEFERKNDDDDHDAPPRLN
ncbi:FxsA family protein [Vibrio sp. V27_P1S3P104]|uniref:FxsA family protein n=1 Tax=unclassified Vibrio TaxID=2614977 RepID=UPI001372E2F5|nr:FxsA family protein [Vibrio sp. V28_P6S34P95]NAX05956.1 FxsA family protein [Vibrio sp. V30_P3S12P165]NAX38066.1 FxsA family protein [Vibrio sp. V27_P1S3P104]NAX41183.1 FxsA family protein [Vibrio sp. V26_P1S5P106]